MRPKGWRKGNEDIKHAFSGNEIALKELLMIFWDRRLVVILSIAMFIIFGIIKIATTPYSYESVSTYISENAAGGVEVSGGLANLFGLSGGTISQTGAGTFSDPSFYPRIVTSRPFLLDLMKESFYFRMYGEELTLEEFAIRYDDKNTMTKISEAIFGFPGRVIRWFEKKPEPLVFEEGTGVVDSSAVNPILKLTYTEMRAMLAVTERIEISSSGGLITVATVMPDREVCAELNQLVSDKLLEFIRVNETQKERRDLDYVERRVASAQDNFEKAQDRLARFRDENRGVVSERAKTVEERLQSEYSIAFGIYQKLATDLEEKRIALEEKTPVLSVFEPVYVPLEPMSRGSMRTLILFIILGVFIGSMVITLMVVKGLISSL